MEILFVFLLNYKKSLMQHLKLRTLYISYSIITSVSCKNLTCFTYFSCCWSLYSFSESLVCTVSKNSDWRDSFVLFINLFLLSMNRINKDSQSFECGVYGLRIPSLLFGEIWSHGLIEQ